MRRSTSALAGSLAALIAVAAAAAPASANGRFPATVDIYTRPGDDRSLYLASTFGLMISHDDGASFHWVCENAIGYGGTFDPKYRVAADGTIYATTFDGLRISRDNGCTWNLAGPPIADIWIDAIDIGPDGAVWVATSQGGKPNDIFVSHDAGKSFASVGLRDSRIWWKSIVVAPSEPRRVYVSGYAVARDLAHDAGANVPSVIALRSDDGGGTWEHLPLTEVALAQSPGFLIKAVLSDNPDTVYALSVGANPPAGDLLYRSDDAGATWTLALESGDAIDALTVRHDDSLIAGTVDDGVWVADAPAGPWARPTQQPAMACSTERSDGTLFACGANWKPDFFALGRSTDGQSWTQVFRFSQLAGPLSCPAGTAQHDTCATKLWPMLADQFGIKPPDAGLSVSPDAGPPGGGGDTGCCDGAGATGNWPVAAALGGLALMLTRRRRQRA